MLPDSSAERPDTQNTAMKESSTSNRNAQPNGHAPLGDQLRRHWLKLVALSCSAYLIYAKDFSVDFQLDSIEAPGELSLSGWWQHLRGSWIGAATDLVNAQDPSLGRGAGPPSASSSADRRETAYPTAQNVSTTGRRAGEDNRGNTYSNLAFDEEDAKRAAKRRKQLAYVARYADVARREMETYGIPASITLAQGVLESNAGESRLATEVNNHFGIKCFSRKCAKGHCANFSDDHHKDFFRAYDSPWESYRSHSRLLRADRYRKLFQYEASDYRSWAKGLQAAGYATDKRYAKKLIHIIEDLQLYRYDH